MRCLQTDAVEAVVVVSTLSTNGDKHRACEDFQVPGRLRLVKARCAHERGHRRLLLLVRQLKEATAVRFAHRIENKISIDHMQTLDVTHAECN